MQQRNGTLWFTGVGFTIGALNVPCENTAVPPSRCVCHVPSTVVSLFFVIVMTVAVLLLTVPLPLALPSSMHSADSETTSPDFARIAWMALYSAK